VQRFTHLGRSLPLTHVTHRWLAGLAAAMAALAWAFPEGRSPAGAAVQSAMTVFLVWALVRELAPDHPVPALGLAAVAGAVSILTGATAPAALAGLMLASRIVVRTTGAAPLLTDIVAVGVFVGVFARTPMAWGAGLAVAAAVAVNTNLPVPAPARHVWLAGAVAVAVTVTAVFSDALGPSWSLPGWVTLLLAAAALAATFLVPVEWPRTPDDRGKQLFAERVRAGRNLVAFALVLATAVGGAAHAEATWPAWLALLGASLTSLRSE
jgi:hypothetical protein